jgi:hypothetical protein
MECAAWPDVRGDFVSTWGYAPVFLDSPEDTCVTMRPLDDTPEAWRCALPPREGARRVLDKDNPQSEYISARVEADIQRFGSSLEQNVERVQTACCDQAKSLAYYLLAVSFDLCASAAIYISRNEEAGTTRAS